MRHDFKRGELVVTIKDEVYPKGSIGMVIALCPPPLPDRTLEDVPVIEVLWFNYKFKGHRKTGWANIDWIKRLEKEDK